MIKNKIKIMSALMLLPMASAFGQGGGTFQQSTMSATHVSNQYLWFDFDDVDYVNGGITFTYPVGTYSMPPKVQITIELKNAVYASGESYVAEITANSAASTTVRVNRVTVGAITEAATNDVTVHVYAIGNANG